MRDLKIAATAAATLLFLGAASPQTPSTCTHGPFRGITETSDTGEIIGNPDPRDWGCALDERGATAGAITQPNGVPSPPPPAGTCFRPAAPNPCIATTRLLLSLQADAQVTLIVYGQAQGHGPRQTFPVRTLLDGNLVAGLHEVTWDGKDDGGVRVAPGIYRAVLAVGAETICGDIEVR